MVVAETIVKSLKSLNLRYPVLDKQEASRFREMRKYLEKSR
jgi:hypothetical protein